MKRINQIVSHLSPVAETGSEYSQSINDNAKTMVDQILWSLQTIFPAWKHSLPTQREVDAYKAQLVRGMLEQGIVNKAQVQMGITRARKEACDFMPSVGKFLSWCKPSLEAYGLADSKTAADEFIRGIRQDGYQYSHPAVYWAGISISSYDRQTMDSKTYYSAYERAYDIMLRRVFAGEQLEQPIPKALPERSVVKTPEEVAQAERARLKAMQDIRAAMEGI